jgi:uncharacterized protein YprB with RNaseH-like and TPR domain
MLRKSFIFLERINKKREQNIWRQDVDDWNSFLAEKKIIGISAKVKGYYDRQIKKAKRALLEENSAFFAEHLPSTEHWRTYLEFRDEALFIDIESDGKKITVIGMYDGCETRAMVGFFDRKILQDEISRHKIIVTFNGKTFDIPVLKKYFGIEFNTPHVDLVHVCRKVGLDGGLKEIEKKLGIKRSQILKHVRGHDAAELWRCWHATGDRDFLDMLIAYNEEDVINLKTIADKIIPRLWKETRRF